jgi:glutathione S-transferase
MKLHWSPKSPFVRKVMIAAHELGLVDRFEKVRSVAAMRAPNPAIMADNPLSKIPTLVLDDGEPIYDSLTICEYFDALVGGGKILPATGPERWTVLTRHALGNGLLDLLILWRNERDKPSEKQTEEWLAAFAVKADVVLDRLDSIAPDLETNAFNVAHIAIGCALSYMDFRFADLGWRNGHPNLARWHDNFASRPSVIATEIVDG